MHLDPERQVSEIVLVEREARQVEPTALARAAVTPRAIVLEKGMVNCGRLGGTGRSERKQDQYRDWQQSPSQRAYPVVWTMVAHDECSFLVLLGFGIKNLLREKIESLLPMLEVVGMLIDVPNVRNVVLL